MLQGKTATQLYKTNVINEETAFSEEYIYVFSFVEGYCIIAAMPLAEAMLMRDASLYTSIFMQVLIFAALFVFIYILIKRVIINNLQKINDTLGRITKGDLNGYMLVNYNDPAAVTGNNSVTVTFANCTRARVYTQADGVLTSQIVDLTNGSYTAILEPGAGCFIIPA